MPKGRGPDDWEIWQVVDRSGIGHELGFESDSVDFNVTRRTKESFIKWIGKPERWGVEPPPEPPVDPEPTVLELLQKAREQLKQAEVSLQQVEDLLQQAEDMLDDLEGDG